MIEAVILVVEGISLPQRYRYRNRLGTWNLVVLG